MEIRLTTGPKLFTLSGSEARVCPMLQCDPTSNALRRSLVSSFPSGPCGCQTTSRQFFHDFDKLPTDSDVESWRAARTPPANDFPGCEYEPSSTDPEQENWETSSNSGSDPRRPKPSAFRSQLTGFIVFAV